jgi:hypothetical protein
VKKGLLRRSRPLLDGREQATNLEVRTSRTDFQSSETDIFKLSNGTLKNFKKSRIATSDPSNPRSIPAFYFAFKEPVR